MTDGGVPAPALPSKVVFLRGAALSYRHERGPYPGVSPSGLLEANKDRFGQVATGARRRGEETWVFGRAGRPCRRCGTPVRTADQGSDPESRVTFWCRHCQT